MASPDMFYSPRISSIPADLTTVKLIDERTQSVHRTLLTSSSENFAAALTGRFFEASKNELILDDTDIKTFGYYTDWLYSGKLLEDVPASQANDYGTMFSIYYFGDRYQIPQLKRAVMTRIIRVSDEEKTIPAEKTIYTAYGNLPESDPLLAWIIDEYVSQWQPSNGDMVDTKADDINQDFLMSLINKMAEVTWMKTRHDWRPGKVPCDYHAHGTDESREKCQVKSKRAKNVSDSQSTQLNPKAEVFDPFTTSVEEEKKPWWRGLRRRMSRK